MNIVSLIKNKVVFYLASRYITYAVQFVTSLVIAVELGPYYMGVWGFILLLLQYFQQFHLGVSNSFNVLYIQHRDNQQECNNYIGNSLVLVSYLALLVILCLLYYYNIGVSGFEKYHIDKYAIWICIIAILQYYVHFFINLFRVKNQLNCVTFCQSIIVILNFACIFFFSGEELVRWLVAGYVVGNMMCVILAIVSGSVPSIQKVKFSISYQKEILKKGLYLFLYNSCFYFIIISIRTLISSNYEVEEFGIFTFSFSLAHAILLVLDALSFVIFPKVISKLSSKDTKEVRETIAFLRMMYITSAHFLIYLALPLFPLLVQLIPKYSEALTSLNLIALTILISINSFSYIELLISRNKEKTMAKLSASALFLNCILAAILVFAYHVKFSYVILATTITYCVYTLSVFFIGEKSVGDNLSRINYKEYMPLRLSVPFSVALFLSVLQLEEFLFIPFLLFICLNWSVKNKIVFITRELIEKPNIVNL